MLPSGMPGKLVAVVVLLVVASVLNLLSGALISAGIQAALLFGVVIGNDGVRTFLRGLAGVNILLIVVLGIPAMQSGGAEVVLGAIIGVAVNVYLIWALGQDDVREWMFRKNFNLDDGSGDGDDVPRL